MPPLRMALVCLALLAIAAPAQAQFFARRAGEVPVKPPPEGTPDYAAEIWPFPAPDPKSWWEEDRPKADEAADPLGGRRLYRNERLAPIDNGIEPSTYRLWGLMPLQWQVVRGDEMILEVWVRPARSVRQTVVRVTLRRDGEVFLNARAGLACCEAGISRRIGFDRQLPREAAARFRAIAQDPMWNSPREVMVDEGAGVAEGLCVDGTSYDLTLLVQGRSRTLRRACEFAEVGQVAEALEATLQSALGQDPRFDVIYPAGASFAAARSAYRDLIAGGGELKPDLNNRGQPPGLEPYPQREDVTPPAAAPGPPGR